MSQRFQDFLQKYKYSGCDYSFLKEVETAATTFEDRLSLFHFEYERMSKIFYRDEDDPFLGQECDRIRHRFLLGALELAQNKKQCQLLLNQLLERHSDLEERIKTKMNTLND